MRKSYKKQFIAACGIIIVLLSGCESRDQIMDGDGMFQTYPYTKITQDEAKRMMEQDDDNVIVDVRRQDEYDEGHIPGTIGACLRTDRDFRNHRPRCIMVLTGSGCLMKLCGKAA